MAYTDESKRRATRNAYYQKHKHTWHKYQYKNRYYGLTVEAVEVQRKFQSNLCGICKQLKKLVVDHCHTTKKFRGLLCMNCNSLLGMAKDNIEILQNATEYLKKSVES